MSAAGIVFLVLFLLAIVAGGAYGLYLYRKDRQCLRKNWNKCKSCQLWQRCKNSKLCQKCKACGRNKTVNSGVNDSDISGLVAQKQQIFPQNTPAMSDNFVQNKVIEVE